MGINDLDEATEHSCHVCNENWTRSTDKELTSSRARQPPKRSQAGWSSGPARTLQNSVRTNKFLHLGRKKSLLRYKLGTDCLGSNFAEKDLEVFVGQQAELPVWPAIQESRHLGLKHSKYTEGGDCTLSVSTAKEMETEDKIKQAMLWLLIRRSFFLIKVVKRRLPGQVVVFTLGGF